MESGTGLGTRTITLAQELRESELLNHIAGTVAGWSWSAICLGGRTIVVTP